MEQQAAIWGTGYIANMHAVALKSNGIPIRVAVDINEGAARAFAQKWGIPKWSTDQAALLDEEICSVHVCTPPSLHYEMVKFLLQHDKHVLCEKPLCFDPAEAEDLARLARERNLACAVNLNVRYHPACQDAKRRVAAEEFGPVYLVHGNYLQEFHAFPAPFGWRYNEALAGSMRAVTEIGTHWLDLAEYLTGRRIVKLQAVFGRFCRERALQDGMMDMPKGGEPQRVTVNSEDSALIQFQMDNGAIGSTVLSEVSHGRTNHLTMEVTGARETVWWDSEYSTALHDASKESGVHTTLYPFGTNGFSDTFMTLATNYYAALGLAIPANDAGFPTFEDGSRLTRLCRAVQRSAERDNGWVEV
ncbi:MAG TPA: Gfo/Idh/MocA family oxidoreductase [Candidatus Flavonifractor merdigallinarum]|uniref:Gfo/Idh/MocA family oxidoreductase n=1 Tax=Candidatus Flavonifractor merdigallinarum TaxID=2838589 RepID=A0A9D1Y9Y4_9FIRM|nr:Gfo/Idh/MocA family oxidoreductase [Candidatus Flavonifractor merdigallinarum]